MLTKRSAASGNENDHYTTKEAGDEKTENHQVQGILLNPELPLREVDNKLGRIHVAKI